MRVISGSSDYRGPSTEWLNCWMGPSIWGGGGIGPGGQVTLGTVPRVSGRGAVPGQQAEACRLTFNLSFIGITLYSHPFGGALLNEDKL